MMDISNWLNLSNPEFAYHATLIVLIICSFAGVAIAMFTYLLLKAGKLKYPSLLIIAIAMLSGIGMIAYAITDHQDLTSLVGVGLGALAAALTHDRIDQRRDPNSKDRSTDKEDSDTSR